MQESASGNDLAVELIIDMSLDILFTIRHLNIASSKAGG